MDTIKIGNNEFNARSSALTSKIYRQLFHKDLMAEMMSAKETKQAGIVELFEQLAFVLIWQAQERNVPISQALKKLSEDDFFEWLEKFDEMDFYAPETLEKITQIWLKNSESLVNSKNLQSLR